MQIPSSELDYIHQYLDALSTKSVRYGSDYLTHSSPSPLRIKRKPVVHDECISIEPKPETSASTSEKFQLSVKVLKPSFQFTIGGLLPTDTVAHLKQRIYQQQSAYPAQRQRLLVKGKVLNDQKRLSELGLSEGGVIHLMLTAAPATPKTGRWGISTEAEEKLSGSEFWEALEKTLVDQVGQVDAKLLLSKLKASLSV